MLHGGYATGGRTCPPFGRHMFSVPPRQGVRVQRPPYQGVRVQRPPLPRGTCSASPLTKGGFRGVDRVPSTSPDPSFVRRGAVVRLFCALNTCSPRVGEGSRCGRPPSLNREQGRTGLDRATRRQSAPAGRRIAARDAPPALPVRPSCPSSRRPGTDPPRQTTPA